MSISRLFPAVLLAALLLSPGGPLPAAAPARQTRAEQPRPPRPEVGCEACLVVGDNGDVLFERRPNAELPNASTTKMMTAVLALREGGQGEEVRVSQAAADAGGGGLDLSAGELWPAESLLAALLLSSSNDAAVALAEHVSGSEEAFVELMNAEARTLGLRHTAFVTPHGLDEPGHYSSARDLAAIAALLLAEPQLRRIVASPESRVRGPRGTVLIDNRNLLLETYSGAIGVKTGYTRGAGNALVSAAVRRERRLIAVVLRSEDSFADTRALLDYGFARLRRTLLLRRGEQVGAVVLDPAGGVPAVARRTVRDSVAPGALGISFVPATSFELPLAAGDVVGHVVVSSGERTVARVPAVTPEAVASSTTSWAAEGLATVLSWGQWIDDPTG
ncbi:MAG: D-alanyl-D-alanine carboxypeptidase family protein [Actinomycetota bacterium]